MRISRTSSSLSRACRRVGRPPWEKGGRSDVGRLVQGRGAWHVGAPWGGGHRAAGRKKHGSSQTVDSVLPVLPGL